MRVDHHRGTDVSEVFSFETGVLPMFWQHLRAALTSELAKTPRTMTRGGSMAFVTGLIILGFIFYVTFTAHQEVVQGLQTWFWR